MESEEKMTARTGIINCLVSAQRKLGIEEKDKFHFIDLIDIKKLSLDEIIEVYGFFYNINENISTNLLTDKYYWGIITLSSSNSIDTICKLVGSSIFSLKSSKRGFPVVETRAGQYLLKAENKELIRKLE